jgi:hypothetical protein
MLSQRAEVAMETKAVERELIELERQYWQALKDRDYATAQRLTEDGGIVTGAQGVGTIDRKTLVTMMEQAPYTIDDYTLDRDMKVRMLGDGIGVVAYKVHEKLTVEGNPVEFDAADTSTWIRRNGSWVCAVHTEAIAGDPFGRDRRAGASRA